MKYSLLAAAVAAANTDPCCVTCPSGQIMTYSVDHIFNMCGESCMLEHDFWKYKIFEPGMHKADSATPCKDQGYANYYETDTHGVPHLISMTVDLYKKSADYVEPEYPPQAELVLDMLASSLERASKVGEMMKKAFLTH